MRSATALDLAVNYNIYNFIKLFFFTLQARPLHYMYRMETAAGIPPNTDGCLLAVVSFQYT